VLPSDVAGKLCLSQMQLDLSEQLRAQLWRFQHVTRELDLSENRLTNIDFLAQFYRLKTLIVDNNNITHNTRFPALPKLKTLFINSNLITALHPFLEHVAEAFPSLQYLSLLDNDANPFLIAVDPSQYANFRIRCLRVLKHLRTLDSTMVTDEERQQAGRGSGEY